MSNGQKILVGLLVFAVIGLILFGLFIFMMGYGRH